ncbi:MAG: rhomboid family intramembrane serine protease [Chloroflexi bacterium]|nr:rhomboid family intramembrane serine protease [Chloroflexota bacterium]
MLGRDAAVPPDRQAARSEFARQTAGECYGFETSPTELDRFVCKWGFQPREFFDTVQGENQSPDPKVAVVLLSIVTALFIHAGWSHILGNMLFLWVFGDNVEDRLGHFRYLVFYLVAGIVATLAQASVDTASVIPVVGASGAIAGVLGAYLVSYPRAKVSVVIPFFILIFIPIPVPAALMIGMWFLQQFLAGVATLSDSTTAGAGVAWFAHIGGFLFGVLTIFLFYGGPRKRVRGAPRWD